MVFSLAVGWAYGALSAPARGWATALAVVVAGVQALAEFRQPADQDTAAAVGGPIGQFLERTLEHGSLVATATAGSTPYYARSIRFIDTLGLNDRHIAHRDVDSVVTRMQRYPGHLKGDGAYVLGRRPDVVILGPAEGYLGRPPKAWFLTDYELLSSAEFRSMYRPFRFAIPITTAEAGHPRVRELSDPSHEHLRFIAYLRLDSPRALGLAYHGQLLAAPWESSTSIPNASRD